MPVKLLLISTLFHLGMLKNAALKVYQQPQLAIVRQAITYMEGAVV